MIIISKNQQYSYFLRINLDITVKTCISLEDDNVPSAFRFVFRKLEKTNKKNYQEFYSSNKIYREIKKMYNMYGFLVFSCVCPQQIFLKILSFFLFRKRPYKLQPFSEHIILIRSFFQKIQIYRIFVYNFCIKSFQRCVEIYMAT